MFKKTLFFPLILVIIAISFLQCKSSKKAQFADGLTITKFSERFIFTLDGRKIPLRPKGFENSAVVLFVRHAEKLSGDDPGLTDQGLARAEKLKQLVFPLNIQEVFVTKFKRVVHTCLLYTSPSPRDQRGSRMPSSA